MIELVGNIPEQVKLTNLAATSTVSEPRTALPVEEHSRFLYRRGSLGPSQLHRLRLRLHLRKACPLKE